MSKAVGPYSPIVRAGQWLVISGQVGAVDGRLVDGGIRAQARQTLANVAALLQGEGATLRQVVKTTMFLCSIDDFEVVNEEYAAAFDGHRPARSTVAVAALPLGALIELEAWAYEEAQS